MGRHAAADDADAHPLVAAALAARGSGEGPTSEGTHRGEGAEPARERAEPAREGNVGWPGPTSPGKGLGWPGDMSAVATVGPATRRRRGWRRILGLSAA